MLSRAWAAGGPCLSLPTLVHTRWRATAAWRAGPAGRGVARGCMASRARWRGERRGHGGGVRSCGGELAGEPRPCRGRSARHGRTVLQLLTKTNIDSARVLAFQDLKGGQSAHLKASRPLIRVLVINDNGLWINDFI